MLHLGTERRCKMEIEDEQIIEQIYQSGLLEDMENSKRYKKLLNKYNKLYRTIEDSKLKEQFTELEEIKNELYSQLDKDIFKLGFSFATKLITEGLKNEI